jgi:cytochrome c biogenesis protein CcdA
MSALVLAFLAGALTTINPCILPLLPILVVSAYASGGFGPVALGAGLVTSFTLIGVAISASGNFLGLDPYALRNFAAVIFVLAGIALLVPAIERRLSATLAPFGNAGASLAHRIGGYGLVRQFGVGLLAGVIWTPCSGPSLAAAFALAAEAGGIPVAALRMFVFGLGAATVIALLAFGTRAITERRRRSFSTLAHGAKPVAGGLFLLIGVAVLAGWDKWLESRLLDYAPDWYIYLTTSV